VNPDNSALVELIRDEIGRRGPVSFAWFMEQALYHPQHGYYASGRAAIGRRGDYFTNISVGPLFGRLLAAQFGQMWERLDNIDHFVIVEQGAYHGDFARDVLVAIRKTSPVFFSTLQYRIVEPFPLLQDRQSQALAEFADKISWQKSIGDLEPFSGVHFSNELLDSMPVHLIAHDGQRKWQEKFVAQSDDEFVFVKGPLSVEALHDQVKRVSPIKTENYETEVNLAALNWIENLSPKLKRGFILAVDYGLARDRFYVPERTSGTLLCFSKHGRISSPLKSVGEIDITAHVDWTSLAERAETCGATIAGFTDQHHFITGIISELLNDEFSGDAKAKRALQTLLHPEMLGRVFQVLALAKDVDLTAGLSGFKFARPARSALGI
jgi:SAM-dependent MidA family methyltransferase